MLGKLTAQFDSSFDQVLSDYDQQDIASRDKSRRNQIVAAWPGNQTMDGIRSIVRELVKPAVDGRRSSAFAILRHSKVPHDQIVSYLLEGAEANLEKPVIRGRYMSLFCEFPQDNRILAFLSPLLDNKEFPNGIRFHKPGEERVDESPWRVCDSAHGAIIQILEKRGEIKPDDPGYGDPGGEATILKRERNIALLKEKLIQSGYYTVVNINPLATTPPPHGNSASKHPKNGYPKTVLPKDAVNEPNSTTNGTAAHPLPRDTNWFLWLFVSIITLSLIGLFIIKRHTARSKRK